jgi:hypothetical protein
MKIHQFVTISLLGIIPVLSIGTELKHEEIVAAGNVVKQYSRPRLSLNNCIEALKYVCDNNTKSASVKYLRDIYSRQLELAASHHFVIWDQSKNLEIKNLSITLWDLESKEAKLCKDLESPDALMSFYNFLGQSMAIGFTARDSIEAEKQREQAFKTEANGLFIKNLQFAADIENIRAKENTADEKIAFFLKLHPDLKNSEVFNSPVKELLAEFNQRGSDGINKLKSSEYLFYSTLIGYSSDRLHWTFEEGDKLISLKINEQKSIGNCVVSDITITVEGLRSGVRNFSLKVAHIVRSDRGLEVLGIN